MFSEGPRSDDIVQYRLPPKGAEEQLRKLYVTPRNKAIAAASVAAGVFGVALNGVEEVWPPFLIVLGLVYLFILRAMPRTLIREHPELLETQTLTFNEEKFSISNSSYSVTYAWRRVKKVSEDATTLVLYMNSFGPGALIIKEALSEDQLGRLLRYIEGAAANQKS